jgi:hypothetical protein
MRDELRKQLRLLQSRSGEVLHGIYNSAVSGLVDAENVLFYNVGAACFASAAVTGMRFERGFTAPDPPVPLGGRELHHVRYSLAPPGAGLASWAHGPELAGWDRVPCPRITEETKPAMIWYAARIAGVTLHSSRSPVGQPYGLELTVHTHQADPGPVRMVKPLLDGLISSLHVHDGSDLELIAERLCRQLPAKSADAIGQLLMDDTGALLGQRRLVWPRATGVQWNPADDLCHAVDVRAQRSIGDRWISGRVFALEPRV